MKEIPSGIGVKVPKHVVAAVSHAEPLVPFEDLAGPEALQGLATMIQEIPPIAEMAAWLRGDNMTLEGALRLHVRLCSAAAFDPAAAEMRLNLLAHTSSEQRAARTRKLTDIREGSIPTAVFDVLRWIIASNTSYLREIEDPAHQVQGVPPTTYRQFLVRSYSARRSLTTQFVTGSPEKETKLRAAIQAEQVNNANARTFPTLFAWHGSGLRNWHSILRVGLHFQKVRLCRR